MADNITTFELSGFVKLGSKTKPDITYKEDFIRYVKQFGWEHKNLTKKTDYLISSANNTNKCYKAKSYGIPILTYEEAMKIIEREALWEII
jgi:hypothetical protein